MSRGVGFCDFEVFFFDLDLLNMQKFAFEPYQITGVVY